MIYFSAKLFLWCFYGLQLTHWSDEERADKCFNQSVCVGSYEVCKDRIGLTEGDR
jgi:hypothetical protein